MNHGKDEQEQDKYYNQQYEHKNIIREGNNRVSNNKSIVEELDNNNDSWQVC